MSTCLTVLITFLNQYGNTQPIITSRNVAFYTWAKVDNYTHMIYAGKRPKGKWKTKVSCTYADNVYKVYEKRSK